MFIVLFMEVIVTFSLLVVNHIRMEVILIVYCSPLDISNYDDSTFLYFQISRVETARAVTLPYGVLMTSRGPSMSWTMPQLAHSHSSLPAGNLVWLV